jgi:hypothetical protein
VKVGKRRQRLAPAPWRPAAPDLRHRSPGKEEEAQAAVHCWEAASPSSSAPTPAPPQRGRWPPCAQSLLDPERREKQRRGLLLCSRERARSRLQARGEGLSARERSSGRGDLPPGRRAPSSTPSVLPPLRLPPLFPSAPPDLGDAEAKGEDRAAADGARQDYDEEGGIMRRGGC